MHTLSRLVMFIVCCHPVLAQFTVQLDDRAGRMEIRDGARLMATYAFRDAKVRRPYFANVKAPNGTQVTRHFPPREGIDPIDHDSIHPGIWLAFGDINGADFWRNQALIRHERFVESPRATTDALFFATEHAYIHQGQTLCVERARYEIHRRAEGYLFLLDSTFRARQKIDFGDQQEMGLGIRLATALCVTGGNGHIVNSNGQVNESQGWGKRAQWCDYGGTINGHRTGGMLMPDPRQFRASRFHSRDYGFTAANPFADRDFDAGKENHTVIPTGKHLHLKFGLLIYSRPDAEPMDRQAVYQDFLETLGAARKPKGPIWARHTIDAGSRGADGIRVADINADGQPDLTTGWEEGGQVRIYLHPGPAKAHKPWPKTVVGHVASPEDAVFVDADGDGRLDVVSSCEGSEQAVFVHWAPAAHPLLLDAQAWTTAVFPATRRAAHWMYCLPIQIDGRHGVDLVLGSKGSQASVGWLESPSHARGLGGWPWHPICDAGWIMSLRHRDVDGDGDQDIMLSDRCGQQSGCAWLERPNSPEAMRQPWNRHPIAGDHREVMFMDLADLDGDGREDLVSAVRQDDLVYARRLPGKKPAWEKRSIPMPQGVGTGKGAAVGDMDGDGRADVVVTCEHAEKACGVFWLAQGPEGTWSAHDISGSDEGVKFDRIELLDLDVDGDLDVVTCEERDNLGVIWFENPSR